MISPPSRSPSCSFTHASSVRADEEVASMTVMQEWEGRSTSFSKGGNTALRGLAAAEIVGHYTESAVPLREQDLKVLRNWFNREEMFQIETDIMQNLLYLFPEPCWEEDPFEFLREFL
jgi:hypothetical protein